MKTHWKLSTKNLKRWIDNPYLLCIDYINCWELDKYVTTICKEMEEKIFLYFFFCFLGCPTFSTLLAKMLFYFVLTLLSFFMLVWIIWQFHLCIVTEIFWVVVFSLDKLYLSTCLWTCSLKDLNNVTDTRNTPSVPTVSVSSSALFIIPDYLICMRYPRVCVTLRETKQVQKWLCVAILAFFFVFLLSDWNVWNSHTQVR